MKQMDAPYHYSILVGAIVIGMCLGMDAGNRSKIMLYESKVMASKKLGMVGVRAVGPGQLETGSDGIGLSG